MTILSGAQSSGHWFKVIPFDYTSLTCVVYSFLYNNQINARALIGQSAVGLLCR